MDKNNLVEKVREIALRATEKEALELVHVEMVGSGKKKTIRIYIDKATGITHEDCRAVSKEVDKILEEADPISNAYTLEVSSPGIERGLYKLKDFERFADNLAKIKTHSAIGNQKNFRGMIKGVEAEEIIFDDKTSGILNIPHSNIKKANLEFDIEKELRQAKKQKS